MKGLLTGHQLFLLNKTFTNIKNILPHKEKLVIETLRLFVTDTGDLETPHCVEDYRPKRENRWGWSFHLSLFEEGTYLCLWDDDNKRIQYLHIPFGCAILTRSDLCCVGLGYSPGSMMFQGNFVADPTKQNLRDIHMCKVEPARWAAITKDAATMSSLHILTEIIDLIKDKTLDTQVHSIVQQL